MNKNFFALISIILAGLMYPFFISPLWLEVGVWQTDKAQVALAQEKVDRFIERYNELEKRKEAFSDEDLERLSFLLPQSVNILQTIVDIETITQQNNFILKGSVGVQEKAQTTATDANGAPLPKQPYDTTTFTINVVGPYSSLRPYIESLAKSLTLFDITSISFATSDTGIYDFQIVLRTYSLPSK